MSSIFHYTKLSTLIEHILPTGHLRSNNLAAMNDPRESQAWSFADMNLPYGELFDEYNEKTHIDCQFKFGKLIKNRFQVTCFSGASQNGWDNEMMWAHYSDNHMGVCLEFDEEQLSFNIQNAFSDIAFSFENVNYSKLRETPWIYWDRNVSINDNIENNITRIYQDIALRKSHFWEKEDERRLVVRNSSCSINIPIKGALKAIYFGLGFRYSYLPAIEDKINGDDVILYDLIYQSYKYERWVRKSNCNKIPISRKFSA